MKKYLIPVGILLLAMACGRSKESRTSRPEPEPPSMPPAEQIPTVADHEAEKVSAENGNGADDTDYAFTSTYHAGDANLNLTMDQVDGSALLSRRRIVEESSGIADGVFLEEADDALGVPLQGAQVC